jgi:predicted nucleotide-binding protein
VLQKRAYLSQEDVPGYSLEQALRVATAIGENFAYKPSRPLNVAGSMGLEPKSRQFRGLAGAAIAYGLTRGGYNAPEIALEPLGLRIVRPTREGDDLLAKRQALLKPRIIGEFLRQYDGAPLPPEQIGRNVLQDKGVPADRAGDVLRLILEGADSVGFLRQIKGKRYVDLQATVAAADAEDQTVGEEVDADELDVDLPAVGRREIGPPPGLREAPRDARERRRVFVTHGTNRGLVEPIKKLLAFGELEPVVSVERTSVSQPVPDKVMNDMRSCGAAIIHVDAEQTLLDRQANEHVVINPNVLIEIGAAIALFGRRFILLVKEGVKLPSNLQGLFEVRYTGETLDGEATIKLLEAINDMKNHPLPGTEPETAKTAD